MKATLTALAPLTRLVMAGASMPASAAGEVIVTSISGDTIGVHTLLPLGLTQFDTVAFTWVEIDARACGDVRADTIAFKGASISGSGANGRAFYHFAGVPFIGSYGYVGVPISTATLDISVTTAGQSPSYTDAGPGVVAKVTARPCDDNIDPTEFIEVEL